EQGGGKAVQMGEHVAQPAWPAPRELQELGRRAPRGAVGQEEVRDDRVEQQPAYRPADRAREPDDQVDQPGTAALGLVGPLRHGAVPAPVSSVIRPLARTTDRPARAARRWKSTRPPSMLQWARAASPGCRAAVNRAWSSRRTRKPVSACRPANTWSSNSAPGTIGLPGKCPGSAGCAGSIRIGNST